MKSVARLVKIEPRSALPKPFTTNAFPAKTSASLKISAFTNQISRAKMTKNVKIVFTIERNFSAPKLAPIPKLVSKSGSANEIKIGRKNAISKLLTNNAKKRDKKASERIRLSPRTNAAMKTPNATISASRKKSAILWSFIIQVFMRFLCQVAFNFPPKSTLTQKTKKSFLTAQFLALSDGVMAAQVILVHFVQVRILVGQPLQNFRVPEQIFASGTAFLKDFYRDCFFQRGKNFEFLFVDFFVGESDFHEFFSEKFAFPRKLSFKCFC